MAEERENNQNEPQTPNSQPEGVTPAARDKGIGGDQVNNWGDIANSPGGRQGEGSHPTDMGPPRPNDQHLDGVTRKGETEQEQKNQERDENPPRL